MQVADDGDGGAEEDDPGLPVDEADAGGDGEDAAGLGGVDDEGA
jgi:hypothetical protein